MTTDLVDQAKQWIEDDPNISTKKYLQDILSSNDAAQLDKLKKYFGDRVPFGTAGLRAEMGPGPSCMNDLLIIQTAQGLYLALCDEFGEDKLKEQGIVVGYDHRAVAKETDGFNLSSKRFAVYTAEVFLLKGVKVYIYEHLAATPLVPFGVQHFKSLCGVMVTASHNPRKDNGFKVYWNNACQIISPVDKNIAKKIDESQKPWVKHSGLSLDNLRSEYPDLLEYSFAQVFEVYMKVAAERCLTEISTDENNVNFVYTAMHGVGLPFTSSMLENFGFQTEIEDYASKYFSYLPSTYTRKKTRDRVNFTAEQVMADPMFPTVDFPNPEEGEGALKLAMETAERNNCKIVLANDPDADRLAVAELDNEWRIFTGNEIAALLLWWQLHRVQTTGNLSSMENLAVVTSTVSSKLMKRVAEVEGLTYGETLTGFKWIGNKCADFEAAGKQVLFSYEEAIGFCVGDLVKDKDGVVAAAVFAQLASYIYMEKLTTCSQMLEEIYEKYGYFVSENGYIFSYDSLVNKQIFDNLRKGSFFEGRYISQVGDWQVRKVRDLLAPGFDSSTENKLPELPVSSSSNMISFVFKKDEFEVDLTLRMSGTEPKLKYYSEINGKSSPEVLQQEIKGFVEDVVKAKLLKL
eukprot:snap_masked-scaffold_5-processed-gene-1.39-mRNA-1 protein AED:0.01 eAED:0.01 QI:0/-1/0/1/-1/1/1/0/631